MENLCWPHKIDLGFWTTPLAFKAVLIVCSCYLLNENTSKAINHKVLFTISHGSTHAHIQNQSHLYIHRHQSPTHFLCISRKTLFFLFCLRRKYGFSYVSQTLHVGGQQQHGTCAFERHLRIIGRSHVKTSNHPKCFNIQHKYFSYFFFIIVPKSRRILPPKSTISCQSQKLQHSV